MANWVPPASLMWDGKTSLYHIWCGGCGGCGIYGATTGNMSFGMAVFVIMSFSLFALETFETQNAQYPKNGFVIEMLLFLIFWAKNA